MIRESFSLLLSSFHSTLFALSHSYQPSSVFLFEMRFFPHSLSFSLHFKRKLIFYCHLITLINCADGTWYTSKRNEWKSHTTEKGQRLHLQKLSTHTHGYPTPYNTRQNTQTNTLQPFFYTFSHSWRLHHLYVSRLKQAYFKKICSLTDTLIYLLPALKRSTLHTAKFVHLFVSVSILHIFLDEIVVAIFKLRHK